MKRQSGLEWVEAVAFSWVPRRLPGGSGLKVSVEGTVWAVNPRWQGEGAFYGHRKQPGLAEA